MLPSVSDGRTLISGAPSVRETPLIVRGCWLRVEELDRARDLHVGVRRDRVHEPVLAVEQRLVGQQVVGPRGRLRLRIVVEVGSAPGSA